MGAIVTARAPRTSGIASRLEGWSSGIAPVWTCKSGIAELAAYLGHVNVGLTYCYIEAVPELLDLAADYLDKDCLGERP